MAFVNVTRLLEWSLVNVTNLAQEGDGYRWILAYQTDVEHSSVKERLVSLLETVNEGDMEMTLQGTLSANELEVALAGPVQVGISRRKEIGTEGLREVLGDRDRYNDNGFSGRSMVHPARAPAQV